MPGTGDDILALARKHIGERYVWGSIAPKNNYRWKGPWDCAEFASWLVFQVGHKLYGCASDTGNPALADAYTGYWLRDAESKGQSVSVGEAAHIPGAAVLRHSSAGGHIVISDGNWGTVEAYSTARGVIRNTLRARRFDMGVLVPGIKYRQADGGDGGDGGQYPVIYRLTHPFMSDGTVKNIQEALAAAGFDPGPIDGVYGPKTAAAVRSYQAARRLVVDGEVGPQTARSLKVKLPRT